MLGIREPFFVNNGCLHSGFLVHTAADVLSGIGVATEAVLRREDCLDIYSFFDQGINNVLTVLNLSARDGKLR